MTNNSRNGGKSRIPAPVRTRVSTSQRKYTPTMSNNYGQARTPLLPVGVNNRSTAPSGSSDYNMRGEEVVSIINVSAGSTPGQIIYNALITPQSTRRLGLLAACWQRIDWRKASLHLVALNGSTVQSGYTMGWLEDPEASVPTSPSDVIPFLTALRSTTVRQNWVESTSGCQVNTPDKPEMYTSRGSDLRRFSPGRLVVAVAGDVGASTTFQLMLRYHVRLYVPFAGGVIDIGLPGLEGRSPLTSNVAQSASALTYPGLGSGLTAGDQVTSSRVIAAIETQNFTSLQVFPGANTAIRLFPPGKRFTIGPQSVGTVPSVIDDDNNERYALITSNFQSAISTALIVNSSTTLWT